MSSRSLGDRRFDAPTWRVIERAYQLGRDARRELARRRRHARLGGGGGHPVARSLAALGPAPGTGEDALAAWTLRALQITLGAGGYARATEHAIWLLARLDRLAPTVRRQALPPALELLLAIGEAARARSLADGHRGDLAATAAGATLLGLLDLVGPIPPLALPDGRLDPLGLARRIEAGSLDAAALQRLLHGQPQELLRNPQLHLLTAMTERADRHAAAAAINRFLRDQRLPRCELATSSGQFLRDLWFPAGPAAPPGPLVSIVIAAYRSTATVGYAIDSLLAQTYRNVEILVCDDASADGTLELIAERYHAVPRVRIFASTANQGPYNLRNHLLAAARGDLVTFHDADDLALPTRIATQVERLGRGAVASLTTWLRVTPDGRFVFFKDQSALRLSLVSLMAPRALFADLGGFRPARFGADLDFYERLRSLHDPARIDIVRRPHLFGLWSPSSLTRQAGSEAHEDGFRSPSRRRYSDLLFDRAVAGLPDADIDAALRSLGNWADPHPIRELPR